MRTQYRLNIRLRYIEDRYDDVFDFVIEAHSDEEAKRRAAEMLVAYPDWQFYTLSRQAWDVVQDGSRINEGEPPRIVNAAERSPFRTPRT